MPEARSFELRKYRLCPFCRFPSKYRFHPSIFPAQAGLIQSSLKLPCEGLQVRDDVWSFRIEVAIPILQVRQAGFSNTFALFKRSYVLNVQFQRIEQGVFLLIGAAN